jgi:hypothetical protein
MPEEVGCIRGRNFGTRGGLKMTQKFECIEKHLYRRQYQTAGRDWSAVYYARFVDWKKTGSPWQRLKKSATYAAGERR